MFLKYDREYRAPNHQGRFFDPDGTLAIMPRRDGSGIDVEGSFSGGGGGGGDGCDCPTGITMAQVLAAIATHDTSSAAHAFIRTLITTVIEGHEADSDAHAALLGTLLDGLPVTNNATGDLTFKQRNGATLTINTLIDSLVNGWDYDFGTHEFVITKQDGTEIRIDASDLVKVYEGYLGEHIQIVVDNDGTIRGILLDDSVGIDKLTPALRALINGKLDATDAGLFLRRDEGDAVGLYTVRDFADTAAAITYSTANPSTIVFAAIPEEEVEP